ncbi:unnamed protein product [Dicrocoelium dendriticum]|nr:unnamed protein product [Dicrocoelium dendriticum]
MRCLWLVWSLLTWLAAILCTVGCLLPYWLKGYVTIPLTTSVQTSADLHAEHNWKVGRSKPEPKVDLPTDLGLFRRCGYPIYMNQSPAHDAHQPNVQFITPVKWEHVCGHYSYITSVPHKAWRVAFVFLIIACVLLFFVTFFLFMLGFALYLLSVQGVYRSCQAILLSSGRCHVGWAYVLTCSGGLLTLFSATLPIIFPKSNTNRANLNRSQAGHKLPAYSSSRRRTFLCCWPPTDNTSQSIPIDRLGFFPAYQHSPANSLDTQSLIYQPSLANRPASVIYMTRPDGVSTTGSASPVASLLNHHLDAVGTGNDDTAVKLQSTTSLNKLARPSLATKPPIMPPYSYVYNYVPQRYSTGALFGHFHPLNGVHLAHPASQRVSVTVNTDPLIYVAEEDEADAADPSQPASVVQSATEKPVDGNAECSQNTHTNDGISTTMQPSSSHPVDPASTQSAKTFRKVANGPVTMVPAAFLHPMGTISTAGAQWIPAVSFAQLVSHTGGRQNRPSVVQSETIRRKRASCML